MKNKRKILDLNWNVHPHPAYQIIKLARMGDSVCRWQIVANDHGRRCDFNETIIKREEKKKDKIATLFVLDYRLLSKNFISVKAF